MLLITDMQSAFARTRWQGDADRKKEEPMRGRTNAQGLVEYGLIIALVAVLAIAGLLLFGPAVSSMLSNLATSV